MLVCVHSFRISFPDVLEKIHHTLVSKTAEFTYLHATQLNMALIIRRI
jgi:hypothetical protein